MTRLAVMASHPVQYHAPLFRELARDLDVTVFYAHNANAEDQALAGFGVGFAWDVDLFSGYSHEFLTNIANQPGLAHFNGLDTPDIGKRLRNGRFDALMLMGWHFKCFLQALFAAKVLGMPVMVRGDSHLETPRSALKIAAKRAVYPHFLRQFDAALFVGKRNQAYWEHYGYPLNRMFHSPHCVDNEWFADRATPSSRQSVRNKHGIPHDAMVVTFAGKLVQFKRPADVVDGVARTNLDGIDVRLLVAGAGELGAAISERANKLNIKMHALGFCNQSEMPGVYAASDLLVLPSDSRETWGLVVNESLACGTPVLVSDAVGCAPDIAEHLGADTVFAVGDITSLRDRMESALQGRHSLTKLSRAAAHFGLPKAAEGVLSAAATVLSSRRRRG